MFDAITAHKGPLDLAAILAIAARLRLDTAVFTAAMDVTPQDVQTDLDEGQRRGILGAPVIFLNHRRIDGIQRESFYTAIADDELKQIPAAQATLATPPSAKAVTDFAR
jgi:protein-disulfide isomerase